MRAVIGMSMRFERVERVVDGLLYIQPLRTVLSSESNPPTIQLAFPPAFALASPLRSLKTLSLFSNHSLYTSAAPYFPFSLATVSGVTRTVGMGVV
jgi:hypothetical protein